MSLFWQLSSLLPNGSNGKIRMNEKQKVLEKEQPNSTKHLKTLLLETIVSFRSRDEGSGELCDL